MQRKLCFLVANALAVFCLNLATSSHADEATTCDLHVEIVGLESDRGELIVALFAEADAFDQSGPPLSAEHTKIADREASAEFTALPCNHYAIKVFHDENVNGTLDTNFVGYPSESFGFSNDAMGTFGPPSFDDARFETRPPRHQLTIHMK